MENEERIVTMLIKVPAPVDEALRAEAVKERRSRQAQLVRILEERYSLIAEESKADDLREAV
jgi:hypothetical protein